jgi:hypothetical protein
MTDEHRRLARLGQQFGQHLVEVAQRPVAGVLGRVLRHWGTAMSQQIDRHGQMAVLQVFDTAIP